MPQRWWLSVYVNPTQFAPGEDLSTYPRDFEGDLLKLQPLGIDVVFNPFDLYIRDAPNVNHNGCKEAELRNEELLGPFHQKRGVRSMELNGGREEIGEQNGLTVEPCVGAKTEGAHETWIQVERLEKPLCGLNRPIFFKGVATVVAKLFNIVEPDVAVFGKKDYQQWRVICRMVQDLDFAVEIVGCPILRELDGLAMSSRNVRLSPAERQKALCISRTLKEVETAVKIGEVDAILLTGRVHEAISAAGGKVDYVKIVDQQSLNEVDVIKCPVVLAVAARFGTVRLLDNIELQPPAS